MARCDMLFRVQVVNHHAGFETSILFELATSELYTETTIVYLCRRCIHVIHTVASTYMHALNVLTCHSMGFLPVQLCWKLDSDFRG